MLRRKAVIAERGAATKERNAAEPQPQDGRPHPKGAEPQKNASGVAPSYAGQEERKVEKPKTAEFNHRLRILLRPGFGGQGFTSGVAPRRSYAGQADGTQPETVTNRRPTEETETEPRPEAGRKMGAETSESFLIFLSLIFWQLRFPICVNP